jgi:uncharacterized lipoprotein NlpE involved in copper resistance
VFTVSVVTTKDVENYTLKSTKSEVDTTITKDTTAGTTDFDFSASVYAQANGASINVVTNSAITYTVTKGGTTIYKAASDDSVTVIDKTLDASGNSAFVISGSALSVSPVYFSSPQYKKMLEAGTYTITATFAVEVATGTGTQSKTTSTSFVVKDSQDTSVGITVKKNDLNNTTSLTNAFTDPTYVNITYDNEDQNIHSVVFPAGSVTVAGNSAYVTTVQVYVTITGTSKQVLVTVPVYKNFTNYSTT